MALATGTTNCAPESCTTRHNIFVFGDAAPSCQEVEQWTEDVCRDFVRSECGEFYCGQLKDALHWRGWGVEAKFHPEEILEILNGMLVYGWAAGRRIEVGSALPEETFRHELAHILIDRLGLAPWGNEPHHAWMARCL